MRRLLALAAVAVALAGCASTPPASTPSTSTAPWAGTTTDAPRTPTSDPATSTAMFLLAREDYWINDTGQSGTGSTHADFPHCSPVNYRLDPDHVTLLKYGQSPRPRPTEKSLVVRPYENRTAMPFGTTGSPRGIELNASDAETTVFKILSPFDRSLVLATVLFDHETVRVNGVELHEGETTLVRDVHQRSEDGRRYEVTEQIRFEHRGPTPVNENATSQMCI